MPAPRKIPLPAGNIIQWALTHEADIRQAIHTLNQLLDLRAEIVSQSSGARPSLEAGGERITLSIPIRLPNNYGTPTGTLTRTTFATSTVTTPQLAERVAALIVDLQQTGIMPPA